MTIVIKSNRSYKVNNLKVKRSNTKRGNKAHVATKKHLKNIFDAKTSDTVASDIINLYNNDARFEMWRKVAK